MNVYFDWAILHSVKTKRKELLKFKIEQNTLILLEFQVA